MPKSSAPTSACAGFPFSTVNRAAAKHAGRWEKPSNSAASLPKPWAVRSRNLAMNRIDRLMATILLLQGRRVITAEDIADHFEISLRTVYRDIAALSEGGVPIVAEAGVGYSLLNGYQMPPVMFTPEEAGALFL